VRSSGAVPIEFTTIAISDGIAMGHEGMRASLISREVIADSVELVMHAERFDGMVTIAGCDKSLPGMLMASARLNLPSVFLYGGTIMPGELDGEDITIQDVFEAVGANARGKMSDEQLLRVERNACPAPAPARGCTPRTRWRAPRRRSACRCREPRRRRPSTRGARSPRATRERRCRISWSEACGLGRS
jgi:dihydroxy-acid dehydratase